MSFRNSLFKILFTLLALLLAVLIYTDAWLLEKFSGNKWSLPAKVYARPLELYVGKKLSMSDLAYELDVAGYRHDKRSSAGYYYVSGDDLTVHLKPFLYWDQRQEGQRLHIHFSQQTIKKMRADNGKAIVSARLQPIEIGTIHPQAHEDRVLVSLDQVPDSLVYALIATEDKRFYAHYGISLKGIARALISNMREGEIVAGGSTITQQLVKNFFLTAERSYWRKAIEAIMAVMLELRVSKDDILEAYINEVFVAQDGARAIHGFGLASEYLFARPLADLQLHQTALLVAMMKGPSYYHPIHHPERAKKRRNLVIDLLVDFGKLSVEEGDRAKQKPLDLLSRKNIRASFPAYIDLVKRQLSRDYSRSDLETKGLRIFTNLDPLWQRRSQKALEEGVAQIESSYVTGDATNASDINGAVVVVDNASADVLAVVGGRQQGVSGFNRALNARRQIGSLMKPVVYLTALEDGYHLMSPISDEKFTLATAEGVWEPRNFDRQYHGEVPLHQALAQSYNVAAARMAMDLGLDSVAETFQALGGEPGRHILPSMSLGAVEMSPLDVAQWYSTIANHGFYSPIKSIRQVTNSAGEKLKRYPLNLEQRFSTEVMHVLNFALQLVMHEGTGKSVIDQFVENSRVAGKTGTTNQQRDSWFAGYDASKLAVVWLGTDDNASMPITGGSGALPVWAKILSANNSPRGTSRVPERVQYLWVDSINGKLSDENCENAIYLPYVRGTEPNQVASCTIKQRSIIHWFKKWFQ